MKKTEKDKTYCTYTGKNCIKETENINCSSCGEYGNGVRATGGLPKISFKEVLYFLALFQILLPLAKLLGWEISWWIVLAPAIVVLVAFLMAFIFIVVVLALAYKDEERSQDFYD